MLCIGLFVMWCQLEKPSPVPDTFCQNYQPVYLSHADTRMTKEKTDINNRKWKAICRGAK